MTSMNWLPKPRAANRSSGAKGTSSPSFGSFIASSAGVWPFSQKRKP